jgi:hypothetical protein
MAFRAATMTVFLYGFAKNERDNISQDELDFWRRIARATLALDEQQLATLLAQRELTEVPHAD